VYAAAPYDGKGLPDTPNTDDRIYRQSEGVLTLTLLPMDEETLTEYDAVEGVRATFDIGLDLADAAVGAAEGMGGTRPAGRP